MEFEGCFFDTSDYELTKKKLGEGGFGKVYIVMNRISKKLYAAKIINTNGVFTSYDQMMFLRESLILHELDHPAIVKFCGINFHSFEDSINLSPTILTEYYPNGSLKSILDDEKKCIANHNWTPTKKYIILLGIADAMRYLHRAGIIHRDLKPQNILIDADYYPKVCDFGLARSFLYSNKPASMTGGVGTILYMAPEMHEGKKHYGPAVDVYAFALLAYEIITGKEPFSQDGESPTLFDVFRKISSGQRPEMTSNVPDNMRELIEKCWSQDPETRPSFDFVFERLSSDFTHSPGIVDEEEIIEYLDMLKDECKETEMEKIRSIKDDLNKQVEETKKLKVEIDKLENENQNYKEELDKKDDEIKRLQNELNLLKKQDSNYKEELAKKDDEIKKLHNELNTLIKQDTNYKEELAKKDDEIKKLQNELNLLKKPDSNYKEELAKKDDEIKKLHNELNTLKKQGTNYKEELDKKDDERGKLQNELNLLKKPDANYKEELDKKDDERGKLQNELNLLKKPDANYKEELDKKDDGIKKLHNELNLLKNQDTNKCIHVKICEAQKVLSFRFFGKSNPYVTLRLKSHPNNEEICTNTIMNTNNPVWNEEFNLITNDKNDSLIINMYHNDDKMMDQLEFPVSMWSFNGPVDRKEIEIKLNKKKAGMFIFEVQAFHPVGKYSIASKSNKIKSKSNDNSMLTIKLLMISGDNGIGQTTLLVRYTEGIYRDDMLATIGVDYKVRHINIDGHEVNLQILDTASQERFKVITKSYVKKSVGIIIGYDVTNESTLYSIKYWIDTFKELQLDPEIPIVLVGNKIDDVKNRRVSYEIGEKYALENGWSYFETSAKENKGVDELFQFIGTKSTKYFLNKNLTV